MMKVLSTSEAYEHGWHIAPLMELVVPTYEESWRDPDSQETIRKIAKSQDESSYYSTRRYIKAGLFQKKPQRKYSPDLDPVLDEVLSNFYFGEDMAARAISMKHLKEIESEKAAREQRKQAVVMEMLGELHGVPPEELDRFVKEVLKPKFYDGFTEEEFDSMVEDIRAELTIEVATTIQIPDLEIT